MRNLRRRIDELEAQIESMVEAHCKALTSEITGFRSYREVVAPALGLAPSAHAEDVAAQAQRYRESLSTARKLLPARYFDADGHIMDPERCTVHANTCAECGRGLAHDEPCLGALETPVEELTRLRASLEARS